MRPSGHEPERWRRIDAVFGAALETPAEERAAFLSRECGDDQALREEVEALLEAHREAGPHLESARRGVSDTLERALGPAVEGRRIGPFQLVREIGRGGMGVVYLAEDTRIGRSVALKVLPPLLGAGERARKRFLAEARAVAALDHPNIATLYEADATADGLLYLVFAFYDGETLETRIDERGPLDVEEAVRIAARIAAGLHAAHARGIVHRDVKPSNVLITGGGEVKLLDFGVAKVGDEDVTREGVRPGTIAYMSPEQAGGRPIDERTDLWSLGVVLYEMLAGVRPFGPQSQAALVAAILQDDPPSIESRRAGIPEDVVRVVARLLSRSAEERYQTSSDVLEDLLALAGADVADVTIPVGPSARGRGGVVGLWRRANPPLRRLAVASALAGIAAVALLTTGDGPSAGRPVQYLAVLPLVDRTGEAGHEHLVAGMHDALTAELAKIGALDVISRTSVARYRDTELPVYAIARELEVDGVVEGSVFMDGDTLTIAAALVSADPERQLWSGRYRGPPGSVFELGGDVARSIAMELGITLTPAEAARLGGRRRVDARAYDAYALGLFHLEQRDRPDFDLARRYFLEAIEIDSTFAEAHAALAQATGSAAFFGFVRPAEAMPRVRALGQAALRGDSTSAEAHRVLASIALYWDWDWAEAERLARRAVALAPSDAGSHRTLSEVLATQGRYVEALAAVERGAELGRLIPFSAFRPAVVLNYMRAFDEAIARLEEGLEFFTDFWQGHWLLCEAHAGLGSYDAAIAACEAAVRLSGRAATPLGTLGYVLAVAGRRADAVRVAVELEERTRAMYVGGSAVAAVYGGLGELDRAFEWLDRAVDERDIALVHLNDHVFFDPLRADPRFDRVLARVGLAPRDPGD